MLTIVRDIHSARERNRTYLVEEASKLVGPLELASAMNIVDNAGLMVNKLE